MTKRITLTVAIVAAFVIVTPVGGKEPTIVEIDLTDHPMEIRLETPPDPSLVKPPNLAADFPDWAGAAEFRRQALHFDPAVRAGLMEHDYGFGFGFYEIPRSDFHSRLIFEAGHPTHFSRPFFKSIASETASAGFSAKFPKAISATMKFVAKGVGRISAPLAATMSKGSEYPLLSTSTGIATSVGIDHALYKYAIHKNGDDISRTEPPLEDIRRMAVSLTSSSVSTMVTISTTGMTRSPKIGFVAGVATGIAIKLWN